MDQIIDKKPINWIPWLIAYSAQTLFNFLLLLFPGQVLLSYPVALISLILWVILHYKCWVAVSPEFARTTPGLAVGLMFVPVLNLVWLFRSFPSLGTGLYKSAQAKGINLVKNYSAWGTACAIFLIVGSALTFVLPISNYLFQVISFILLVTFYKGITKQANEIINRTEIG